MKERNYTSEIIFGFIGGILFYYLLFKTFI